MKKTNVDMRRIVLYSVSGGLLTVAAGVLCAAEADAAVPSEPGGTPAQQNAERVAMNQRRAANAKQESKAKVEQQQAKTKQQQTKGEEARRNPGRARQEQKEKNFGSQRGDEGDNKRQAENYEKQKQRETKAKAEQQGRGGEGENHEKPKKGDESGASEVVGNLLKDSPGEDPGVFRVSTPAAILNDGKPLPARQFGRGNDVDVMGLHGSKRASARKALSEDMRPVNPPKDVDFTKDVVVRGGDTISKDDSVKVDKWVRHPGPDGIGVPVGVTDDGTLVAVAKDVPQDLIGGMMSGGLGKVERGKTGDGDEVVVVHPENPAQKALIAGAAVTVNRVPVLRAATMAAPSVLTQGPRVTEAALTSLRQLGVEGATAGNVATTPRIDPSAEPPGPAPKPNAPVLPQPGPTVVPTVPPMPGPTADPGPLPLPGPSVPPLTAPEPGAPAVRPLERPEPAPVRRPREASPLPDSPEPPGRPGEHEPLGVPEKPARPGEPDPRLPRTPSSVPEPQEPTASEDAIPDGEGATPVAEEGPAVSAEPDTTSLPEDARPPRKRYISRIPEAQEVREHIRPGLQTVTDDATREFRARPDGRRYTGERAEQLRRAKEAADTATRRRQEEAARGTGGPAVLKRLREEESNAYKRLNGLKPRLAGLEIHAIFERMITARQREILGAYADRYQLRAEAPFGLNGSVAYPGSRRPDLVLERLTPTGQRRYVAHVYDLKTGKKGIERAWEYDIERYARALFKPEELRPSI
ncbi:hypothetical protein SD37_40780 [Amycolatopsis orientalis]|uniref:Uncharacterized protein n=1 Tax=Amycolatopsis orientalis TaxID=31958 RepID=A0A193CAA5_AMYOR|nr:hypothetical protein [Amycolatopsis orientalis]ANN21288.1 hypothetical protein SD37_40780 [Amycolatopsis orientalis]